MEMYIYILKCNKITGSKVGVNSVTSTALIFITK